MNEATQIASMGITTMLELMQARDEIKRLQKIIAEAEKQDEAAPVAKNEGGRITWMIDDWPQNCLLYTHLPQRKPLTDEQVDAIWPLHTFIQAPDRQWLAFARAIEAAHGITKETA